jgi:4,4'-diaponeurosporenoate glycosyltransferase
VGVSWIPLIAAVLRRVAAGLTAAGAVVLWRIPRCRDGDEGAGVIARTTVIIPARDEEDTIPRLLASLARQRVAPHRVMVVDDHSRDATAERARAHGAVVVRPPDKPAGWTGKTWACYHGARAADGEYLLFLDADVWLEDDGLRRLGEAMARGGGVVSVQPYHVVKSFAEQFSSFFHIMMMSGIGAFTLGAEKMRPAGLFGQCLFCRRDDYLTAGGHERVKESVLENLALGRLFAQAGLPLRLYGGRGTLNVRMYPGGFGELIDGWSKAFVNGAGASNPWTLVLGACWIAGCILAPVAVVLGLSCRVRWRSLALYALYVGQVRWMLVRLGGFRLGTAVLFPLHCLFFCAVFVYSALRVHLFHSVRWKGRPVGR